MSEIADDELRAKAPWYVSGTRTRHNAMPVLQIVSEPTGEVLALVPYSDRKPLYHAQCYADARLIASAPELLTALIEAEAFIARTSGNGETDFRAKLQAAISKAHSNPRAQQ